MAVDESQGPGGQAYAPLLPRENGPPPPPQQQQQYVPVPQQPPPQHAAPPPQMSMPQTSQQRVTHIIQAGPENYSLGLAWIMWLLCCCGFSGVHRCYLNKWCTGIVWFFTGGLCCVGQLFDAFFMESLVREANAKAQTFTDIRTVRHGPPSHPGQSYGSDVSHYPGAGFDGGQPRYQHLPQPSGGGYGSFAPPEVSVTPANQEQYNPAPPGPYSSNQQSNTSPYNSGNLGPGRTQDSPYSSMNSSQQVSPYSSQPSMYNSGDSLPTHSQPSQQGADYQYPQPQPQQHYPPQQQQQYPPPQQQQYPPPQQQQAQYPHPQNGGGAVEYSYPAPVPQREFQQQGLDQVQAASGYDVEQHDENQEQEHDSQEYSQNMPLYGAAVDYDGEPSAPDE